MTDKRNEGNPAPQIPRLSTCTKCVSPYNDFWLWRNTSLEQKPHEPRTFQFRRVLGRPDFQSAIGNLLAIYRNRQLAIFRTRSRTFRTPIPTQSCLSNNLPGAKCDTQNGWGLDTDSSCSNNGVQGIGAFVYSARRTHRRFSFQRHYGAEAQPAFSLCGVVEAI